MSVTLFGATDLSLAVAEQVRDLGIRIAGVVYVGARPRISYAPGGLENLRQADLRGWAAEAGIPALEWSSPREVLPFVRELSPTVGLAAGWFHMLGRDVRSCFPSGCVGVHASLLPLLRGGAPLNWAILSGARETGVSLFALGDGVDDGPLFAQRSFAIAPRATIAELVDNAREATVQLVRDHLPGIIDGSSTSVPQVGTPSYGLQRVPADGQIDWTAGADDIDRLIRAVGRPYAGAFTHFDDGRVRIWAAEPRRDVKVWGTPGQIWRDDRGSPCVVTGHGILRITDATDDGGSLIVDRLAGYGNRRFVSKPHQD